MITKDKADFIISLAEPNGYINPETVIEAARNPQSPIHNEFTWDIQEAARTLWIDQARDPDPVRQAQCYHQQSQCHCAVLRG